MAVFWSTASRNCPMTRGMLCILFTSSWAWRNSFFRFFCSSLIYSSCTSRNSSSCCNFCSVGNEGQLTLMIMCQQVGRCQYSKDNIVKDKQHVKNTNKTHKPYICCKGPPDLLVQEPRKTSRSGALNSAGPAHHPVNHHPEKDHKYIGAKQYFINIQLN